MNSLDNPVGIFEQAIVWEGDLASLALQEDGFKRLGDIMPQLMFIADGIGQVTWLNKRWCDFSGQTSDELCAGGWQKLHDPNVLASVLNRWERAIAKGEFFEMAFPLKPPGGRARMFLTRATPLKNQSGEVIRWFGINTDITEQYDIEQLLRLSDERHRLAIEGTNDGIWDYQIGNGQVFWSERLHEIMGYTPQEVPNPGFDFVQSIIHKDDAEHMRVEFERCLHYGSLYAVQYRIRHKQGHWVTVNSRGKAVLDENGKVYRIVGAVTDITEQENARVILRESENRFAVMANSAPVMIWISGPDGKRSYFSRKWLDFVGGPQQRGTENYPEDTSLLEIGDQWVSFVHLDDRPIALAIINEAIRLQQPSDTEYRLRRWDNSYRWMLDRSVVRRTESGEVLGYIGICIDIQDRRQAEEDLKHYVDLLQRSNQELEQFTAIASHDLQEPLRKIQIFADMIQAQVPEDTKDYLQRMQKSAARMQSLISDLLMLSRVNRKGRSFQPIQLNEMVRDILDDYQVMIQEIGATVHVASLGEIYGDDMQIHQLLQNLIGNGLKYRQEGISPVIRIFGAIVKAGRCYRLTVADNGIGIQEDYFGRIFEPFQRLHEMGKYPGTGMGLTICRKIVERHHGHIEVESTLNQGSAFHVTLPLESPDFSIPGETPLFSEGLQKTSLS